jgi:hypothetical protein
MANNQIQKGYDFATGQLVTADNLDALAQEATLKKGAISEQPNMAATKSGTYNYTSGISLNVAMTGHGFVSGENVRLVFTSTSGATGSFFDGVYSIASVPSVDSFNINLQEAYSPSIGNLTARLVPSAEDEILIHDVSDTAQTKPKKISIGELTSGVVSASYNEISTSAINANNSSGIEVDTINGVFVSDATYSSLNGVSVEITRANHGFVPGDVVEVTCTATQGNTGSDYSGIFVVEQANDLIFSYFLKEGAFITIQENTEGEYDQPLISSGTAIYRRIGAVNVNGQIVVDGNLYINGSTYNRGDTFTYGRAKFTELVLPKGRTLIRPDDTEAEEGMLFYNRDEDVVEIFRKSFGFPNGAWETFDKVSNQIIIPASYSNRTLIAQTANQWYSETLWTMPIPARFRQYEIQLPPVRLQHLNNGNDNAMYGKLELIAKEAILPEPNVEYVIARFVAAQPDAFPWGVASGGHVSIPRDNRIITPDDIVIPPDNHDFI